MKDLKCKHSTICSSNEDCKTCPKFSARKQKIKMIGSTGKVKRVYTKNKAPVNVEDFCNWNNDALYC